MSSLRVSDPFFDRHKKSQSLHNSQDVTSSQLRGSFDSVGSQSDLDNMDSIKAAFESQKMYCKSGPGAKDHQDQSFGGINRLPAHVPLRAWESYDTARQARIEEGWADSTYFRLLTPEGTTWKFKFLPSADLAPTPLSNGGFKGASGWDDIPVPCSWECAGYGQAIYTRENYPFKCDPPNIPDGCNHVGCYETTLSVPKDWDGRRVFLVLESVSAAFHCWIDGAFVGYSSDSFCPNEFDVTRFVQAGGEHTLSVRVLRYCEGSYMESQDMWWLSGIQRDVYIYSKPAAAYIWDYKVTTELSGDAASPTAELAVQVQVNGHGMSSLKMAEAYSVKTTLLGPHQLQPGETVALPGNDVEPEFEEVVGLSALSRRVWGQKGFLDAPKGVCLGQKTTRVDGVSPWSADMPWLYTLVLELVDGEGETVDAEVCRVGMRTVGIEDGVLKVNGEALEVRGVNRHEHSDRKGKFCDRALMVKDICLMKQLNFNAVRCSHYPNRTLWYDLCTAYGMWVVNEANLETNGLVSFVAEDFLAVDKSWEKVYVERMSRMVLRDRSHACVIIWSLGNESSYGRNIDAEAKWTRRVDPTRPIQYESCGGASATDIICPMYPQPKDLKRLGESLEKQNMKSTQLARRWPTGKAGHLRPVIMCEYAHAMNNSLGNFDVYWDIIRSHKHLQGGFIWDWVDQGLLTKDKNGTEFWGYGGDFGEAVHDAEWHINGLCWPDRTFHPTVWQVKKTQQPVKLTVEWNSIAKKFKGAGGSATMSADLAIVNRSRFCSLERMGWKWKVEVDGELLTESGELEALDVAPHTGQHRTVEFELSSKDIAGGKEAVLTVEVLLLQEETWAEAGHQVAWEQAVVPAKVVVAAGEADEEGMEVSETRGEVVVEGPEEMRAVFGKAEGGLKELWVGGRKLVGGARAEAALQNFWRANTSNDNGGNDTLQRYGATEQMYPPECGFEKPFPRSKAIIRNVVGWLWYWGDISYGGQWEKAGLNKLRAEDVKVRISRRAKSSHGAELWREGAGAAAGLVKVEMSYVLRATTNGSTEIPCRTVYSVAPSGEMVLENLCDYSPKLPLPARIGMELHLPMELSRLRWYGRAHESYPDRLGVPLGEYEEAVDDTFVRYMVPQENGNKSETRWAAVLSEEGHGLLVSKAAEGETFDISAHRFSAMDLYKASHCKDVPLRKTVTLTVDHRHTAVGGNTSWTRSQMEQWLLPRGTYKYCLRLTPVASDEEARRPEPLSETLKAQAHASSYKKPTKVSASIHGKVQGVSQKIGHSPIAFVENLLEVTSWKITPLFIAFLLLMIGLIGGWYGTHLTIHS